MNEVGYYNPYKVVWKGMAIINLVILFILVVFGGFLGYFGWIFLFLVFLNLFGFVFSILIYLFQISFKKLRNESIRFEVIWPRFTICLISFLIYFILLDII